MRRADDGFVAVEWALAVVLVMAPLLMTVAAVATWAERTVIARSIADESARAAVLAETPGDVAADALRVARATAASHRLVVSETCGSQSRSCVRVGIEGTLVRGGSVTVSVEMPMPGVRLPLFGELDAFRWETEVVERVDDYRSIR